MKEKKEREKPYENKDKIKNNRLKNHFVVYLYYRRHRKGKYFSNFYGGALVNYTELEKISNKLIRNKN
jgi:hypothetical protein